MDNSPHGRHPGAGVRPPAVSPQNPNPNYFQNLHNPFFENPNPFLRNSNPYLQNPNPYFRNPTLPYHPFFHNSFPNPSPRPSEPPQKIESYQPFSHNSFPNPSPKPSELLQKIESAVQRAHRDLVATGESVSAWNVSQSAVVLLQVDSWSSLGLQFQDVPSLYRLILTEGKVNAFIHCFVSVRRITSVYDLDVAICKNEGVDKFEELGLGPLLRHPLVQHYFLIPKDATEIVKITSREIICRLAEFMDSCKEKDIQAEEFLDFVAKKRSVAVREKLGIRIQSLGMHITAIREARKAENSMVKRYLNNTLSKKSSRRLRKGQPELQLLQKQELDKRFNVISERFKSFSADSKHIRFLSSSSEDENDDDASEDSDIDEQDVNKSLSSPQNRRKGDERVTSCPYPSATEEMLRLGLKVDRDSQASPASGISMFNNGKMLRGKKRKSENQIDVNSFCKLPKRGTDPQCQEGKQEAQRPRKGSKSKKELEYQNASIDSMSSVRDRSLQVHDDEEAIGGLSLSCDAMEMFVARWKDICRKQSVGKVFDRMLDFCSMKRRRKMQAIFSSYPAIGLLNVAVTSIKRGMWDSLYDAFQDVGEHGFVGPGSSSATEMIDIGPPIETNAVSNNTEHLPKLRHGDSCTVQKPGVTADDIIKKVARYFELGHVMPKEGKGHLEKQFESFKKFHDCDQWLKKEYSVEDFGYLGHGSFVEFLDKHVPHLSYGPHEGLSEDLCHKSSLEVHMLQNQLLLLLSQAANDALDNPVLTKEDISMLLKKQFPTIGFQVTGEDTEQEFSSPIKKQKSHGTSSSVSFSIPLLGSLRVKDYPIHSEKQSLGIAAISEFGETAGCLGSVSVKDAVECLLKAPMLADLQSWSHWDIIFAPSLGPLLEWLLNEASPKELSCLVTKDGKIIRIDHSATVDEFLEASLRGCSFETAVKLLSLLCLYGGTNHVPLSLLKCYAHRAIEVIVKNSMYGVEVKSNGRSLVELDMSSSCNLLHVDHLDTIANVMKTSDIFESLPGASKAVASASRFILDCLGYLPSEFCSLAADILLSGFKSFIKDASAVILRECNQTDHRLMLHDIGLSLGILDWVEDYHAFSSATGPNLSTSTVTQGKMSWTSNSVLEEHKPDTSDVLLFSDDKMMVSVDAQTELLDRHHQDFTGVHKSEVPSKLSGDSYSSILPKDNQMEDATLIVESIRHEEFGLEADLDFGGSSLLKKQHARLGRALHCLSQELYSQDSHFLLELVQNADDNSYPKNVEPTLVFILQSTGIVILNNEQGFSGQNIRALCDVGNSTKKGSSGYIGQKGIGFKSVFRVTDAPEIHSNGFHVKFDISEGQIGFVLPTTISPCDINLFRRQLYGKIDPSDAMCWNTCIVLPFRSKLKEGASMSSIISMFTDLHPSLLLFLHRLQCIMFRNMLTNSLVIMRKETVEDGIVKVSHGKESMSWLVASKKLQASIIRPDVQTTEIAIAFTLEECNEGYKPHLEQQPVFAFLPLRTYGLKFILQGDFVLPSSREEVDGDSAWNQWLLSEFPALFVRALESFCSLTCFRETPGKAVTAYMSFIPLVGEVHGFFSNLPRMIISKLSMTNCLLLEGPKLVWVPPCRVLRGWDEQVRILLPDSMLHRHLGLGYLNKEIVLSNPLAKGLGIRDYGPEILIEIIESVCHTDDGIKSLGLDWLSSWLEALGSTLSVHTQTSVGATAECLLMSNLRKVPFIPLSDGSYSSLAEGPIWLPCEVISTGYEGENSPRDFPSLFAELRTVNPLMIFPKNPDTYSMGEPQPDAVVRMLHRIGVQRLSAHEVIKSHILPEMSDDMVTNKDKNLMIEYLSFVMLHFQSPCPSCHMEKADITLELQKRAFVLTNHGYKRPFVEPIHFGKDFGNPVDMTKLIGGKDAEWNEVDSIYLKQQSTQSLSFGLLKWREFFLELGVTDFVQIIHIKNKVTDFSDTVSQDIILDGDSNSIQLILEDWQSPELVHLLSIVTSEGCRESCEYLLEIIDKMWDECFSSKVNAYCVYKSTDKRKPLDSSFLKCIREFRWIASSMDDEFHYPKDLFYDCEAVRSILGPFAPYAIPQVKSKKFLKDIGLKNQVSLDDALTILQYWKTTDAPFSASVAQMSKFYTFIWNESASSKKAAEEVKSGRTIFVPFGNISGYEDVVSGVFLPASEVYWHDPTGCMDQIKELILQCSTINEISCPASKTLSHVYPGLCDFFVNECGINKTPPFFCYHEMLLQLSSMALPSQAAKAVFQVLLKWADDVKSGSVVSQEVVRLKECLLKLENTVLPTVQDKWVSLHPSFGIVCWCDDEELRKQFKHFNDIDFLHFGKLNDDEKGMLSTKIAPLMQTIGIPALSKVASREAIFYGIEDSREKALLVDWVLPYAQRYLHKLHPDIYYHLKLYGYDNLSRLKIVVVEKLFYKHTIKGCDITSKKRLECNCLLQDDTLYVARTSDCHSLFLELSRLFFNGSVELHLANFLHLITTMAESGSTREQVEYFVVNSQKIPELDDEETVWSLTCLTDLEEAAAFQPSCALPTADEQTHSKSKRKAGISSSWPPTDWTTAPDFQFARANYSLTKPLAVRNSGFQKESPQPMGVIHTEDWPVTGDFDDNWIVPDGSATAELSVLQDAGLTKDNPLLKGRTGSVDELINSNLAHLDRPDDPSAAPDVDMGSSTFTTQNQLSFGRPNENQIYITGRLGELIAYRYFLGKLGPGAVRWINEEAETGLPYDLIIRENEESEEYIEVKATKSMKKDWFTISTREWQFAAERGDSFSIAHVVLAEPKKAKISVFKNPVKLCQQSVLNLVILMSKQQKESPCI